MAEIALDGIGVCPGIAVGPVATMAVVAPLPAAALDEPAGDPDAERSRALGALESVAVELEERGRRAGGQAAEILTAEAMMARDPDLAEEIAAGTAAGASAPRAVADAFAGYREVLLGAGEYMAARVADLDAVRDRALALLAGIEAPTLPDPGHPFVLVARDLTPADTAMIDPATVLGLVTEEGGPTSHTAILAKALGVPAVVGCAGATTLADGTTVIVDGGAGTVLAGPDADEVAGAERRAAARRAALSGGPTGPGATADGHRVKLLANIGGARDVEPARAAGAEGVGLFRTEFLYLDRAGPPGVDEQAAAYAEVVGAFPGGRVVFRTLDAGADKPLPFLDFGEEPNPALGVRGFRAVLRRPELLDDQLTAIGRAAASGGAEVWVMAPMIATAEEAAWFAERARLQPVAKAGVMVELPAAAIRARAVLDACDFASLGTNDLAQYTFGADRLVGSLAAFQDPWQPALLALVAMTAEAGAATGRPVGVCGEAAGDPALALVLAGLGISSLSMAPASIADVRAVLARHTLAQCQALAQQALNAPDAAAAKLAVREAAAEALDALGL
jgi:phosphotransferase system enzyme I (PtsI)